MIHHTAHSAETSHCHIVAVDAKLMFVETEGRRRIVEPVEEGTFAYTNRARTREAANDLAAETLSVLGALRPMKLGCRCRRVNRVMADTGSSSMTHHSHVASATVAHHTQTVATETREVDTVAVEWILVVVQTERFSAIVNSVVIWTLSCGK